VRISRSLLACVVSVSVAVVTVTAAPADPLAFLRDAGGFSRADLAQLERGEPVARVLDTDRREVAVVGAIRIDASVDRVLGHYRDVSLLGRSSVVEQVGTFSATPDPVDLQNWTLEPYDLETIRECQPGACGIRLSGADMARFSREVNWNAAAWRTAAGITWRRILADYAAGYLANGRGALSEYQNKEVPLSVAHELDLLLEQSGLFTSGAPRFMQYVRDFPSGNPGGTDHLLYWTKDDFGVRPVFSITHLLLYKAPATQRPLQPLAMVAAKQIYATHYFDAGLGLSVVYAHPSKGLYLVAMNRARTRSLTSLLRAFVRSTVRSRCRDVMEKVLRSTKVALEQSR
jgi:hypothetical protein